jgi:NAD(P)-dependent dehydrogenase (short-subunit alcohol dehydrogenase family)
MQLDISIAVIVTGGASGLDAATARRLAGRQPAQRHQPLRRA